MFAKQNNNLNAGRIILLVTAMMLIITSATVAVAKSSDVYLGIIVQDITSKMARALDLDDRDGVLVDYVTEDSPAEAAGIEEGDVIRLIDGKTIEDYDDFTRIVRRKDPGDRIRLAILRDGEEETIRVTLVERKKSRIVENFFDVDEDGESHLNVLRLDGQDVTNFKNLEEILELKGKNGFSKFEDLRVISEGEGVHVYVGGDHHAYSLDRGFMGVHVNDLGEQLGEYFEIDDGNGALITMVVEDSGAEEAGLKAGDVIVSIGNEEILTSGDVHAAMSETDSGDEVDVRIVRKGNSRTVTVTLQENTKTIRDTINLFHSGDNDPSFVFTGKGPHSRKSYSIGSKTIDRLTSKDDEKMDELKAEIKDLQEAIREIKKELR